MSQFARDSEDSQLWAVSELLRAPVEVPAETPFKEIQFLHYPFYKLSLLEPATGVSPLHFAGTDWLTTGSLLAHYWVWRSFDALL